MLGSPINPILLIIFYWIIFLSQMNSVKYQQGVSFHLLFLIISMQSAERATEVYIFLEVK